MKIFFSNTKGFFFIFIVMATIAAGCDKAQNTIRNRKFDLIKLED